MPNLNKRENIGVVLVIVFTLIAFAILYFALPHPTAKVYDCSISEISPDYPLEVKEECRKLRAKNFQEDLRKPK